MGYTEFLNWSFNSNLDEFYESFRWPGWQSEVSALSGDEPCRSIRHFSQKRARKSPTVRDGDALSRRFMI
jgi:Protein of unknown function DUF2625